MDTEKLKNRDYVLVIDKSGSMGEQDCPNGQTRWDYARESATAIARTCEAYDPDGITVIPFAASFKVYDNTTSAKVKDIFTENSPMGGTTLAPVLKSIFDDYLSRKSKGQTKANGQIVLVITDGQPQDEASVAQTIVDFTKKLDNGDDEFGISLIQVGKDAAASKFLKRLDDDLEKQGAKFDIVDTKTMDEVETLGLTETLVAALTD